MLETACSYGDKRCVFVDDACECPGGRFRAALRNNSTRSEALPRRPKRFNPLPHRF
jgi:hypothetical protein